mgnify:CR=1 FL=1
MSDGRDRDWVSLNDRTPNNNDKEDSYFNFLDELSDDADDYEVEKFDSDEDEGCEGGACKI